MSTETPTPVSNVGTCPTCAWTYDLFDCSHENDRSAFYCPMCHDTRLSRYRLVDRGVLRAAGDRYRIMRDWRKEDKQREQQEEEN